MIEKKEFFVDGIEEDSCCSLLSQAVEKLPSARVLETKRISENTAAVNVEFDSNQVSAHEIASAISSTGHAVRKGAEEKEAKQEFAVASKRDLELEKQLLSLSALAFVGALGVEVLAYFAFFRSVPDFFGKYAANFFYLALAVTANSAAVMHIKAYKAEVTCMTGMMLGMTVGMMTGFLLGGLVGATNGMFTGSIVGMVAGMAVGAWCGKCTGIMGVMEGLMAGLMGGTMGAMLTVMLLNDNLALFMPVFVASCLLILVGLSYLVYKEHGEYEHVQLADYKSSFVSAVALATLALCWLMVYGPKSYLFS